MTKREVLRINDLINILEEYREKYCNMKVSITINHGTEIPIRTSCFSFIPDLPTGRLNYDLIIDEKNHSDIGKLGG
jgi:hypothetical protein